MEHTKQFEIVLPAATTTTKIYDVEVAEDLYVNKIDKLQNKTKRYIDEIVTKTGYGGLIEDLDGFTGKYFFLFVQFCLLFCHLKKLLDFSSRKRQIFCVGDFLSEIIKKECRKIGIKK